MKIFFCNAEFQLTANEIKSEFARYGPVAEFKLIERHGQSRGYGFIVMADQDAVRAIKELHNQRLAGRALQVRKAMPQGAVVPADQDEVVEGESGVTKLCGHKKA